MPKNCQEDILQENMGRIILFILLSSLSIFLLVSITHFKAISFLCFRNSVPVVSLIFLLNVAVLIKEIPLEK